MMTMKGWSSIGVLVCSALWSIVTAPALRAQPPVPFDTAYIRTATVGELLRAARVGDSIATARTDFAAGHAVFERLRERLGRPELHDIPLHILADGRVEFSSVLRKQPATALTETEAAALDTLSNVMQQLYPRILTPVVGADTVRSLLDPVIAFHAVLRDRSMLQSREMLHRFERKYGPDAPPRNAAEVVLNFGAQWLPVFRSNSEGWPSRFEMIASYVPTYLRVPLSDGESGAVTVVEVGARAYIWKQGWGGKDGGVLRPGYISFGAVVAGERDGALTSPAKGASRFGAFVGWGDAKVAVIGGSNARLLVTRTFHIVPWAF